MSAPLFKYGLFGDEISLIVAFVIGIGFGFFLERAGLGSARKLTAQFYLTDLSVFKVMFTAIVTAMLGLFYLSWAGWVDISLVYLSPTYLLPQLAGGLLLGLGFVIGGYCPGTSVVAVSTGALDAWLYLAGVMAGIFVFGEMFSSIGPFFYATDMGSLTIPDLIHLPYGVVVLGVVLLALGGFAGAGWVERLFAPPSRES
ncbi:MAG: YeeE/YedE family protein [Acidobacteriota bacterium]|nr:MAG: YeeE/YedE family protein [Acidobacteriota bacterium]